MLKSVPAAALLLSLFAIPQAVADEVSVGCASGTSTTVCERAAALFTAETGHTVRIVTVPSNATEALALYQQLLSAQSSDLDVLQIDGTWQGMLAPFMLDMKEALAGREGEWFPSIINNNIIDGKLVSVPAFTDAGMLYYRKDLLEKYGKTPPSTWQELTATAKEIQDAERAAGNPDMWGFVWQGRAYEGLTCDALEWVYSFGGGTIVDNDGNITINNPKAAEALDLAASWVGDITPQGVLTYGEEEARGVFQAGNAVFMRNWPYAWTPAQADDSVIKDKVGTSVLPKGGEDGQSAATLGGWSYAVSNYSKVPDAAKAFVLFMTSAEFQKIRAIEFSNLPTMPAVYEDPELIEKNAFIAGLQPVFLSAVARPATVTSERYNAVSTEFFNTVHAILSGDTEAAPALAELEGSIARAMRGR